MKIEGTYTFDAPRDVVWSLLLDPDVLTKGMAGCEKMDCIGDGVYEGIIDIPVGPIQGVFDGTVRLSNINAPEQFTLTLYGDGEPGSVKGSGTMRLSGDGESCTVHYMGEAEVNGRLATINQPLLETSARALVRQSLEALDKELHPEIAEEIEVVKTAVETKSQTAFIASTTISVLLFLTTILVIMRLFSKSRRRRHAHEIANILEERGVFLQ